MEKTVETLGDRFAFEAQRLIARRTSSIPWLKLLMPLIEQSSERAEVAERFQRVDGVPQTQPVSAADPAQVSSPEDWTGTPLPGAARERLRNLVGPAVDVARVHVGPQADA